MATHQLERVEEERDPVQDIIHDRSRGQSRASRLDSSRELLSQLRAHLQRADHKLETFDEALLDTSLMLEEVYNYREALASSNETSAAAHAAFLRERQKVNECIQAYGSLFNQHSMTINEVQKLNSDNHLLSEELQRAKESIQASELSEHPVTELVDIRIAELETEKASMIGEYQQALVNAADRICSLDTKLNEVTHLLELKELGSLAVDAKLPEVRENEPGTSSPVQQETFGEDKEPKRRRVKSKRATKMRLLKPKSPTVMES